MNKRKMINGVPDFSDIPDEHFKCNYCGRSTCLSPDDENVICWIDDYPVHLSKKEIEEACWDIDYNTNFPKC